MFACVSPPLHGSIYGGSRACHLQHSVDLILWASVKKGPFWGPESSNIAKGVLSSELHRSLAFVIPAGESRAGVLCSAAHGLL